MITTKSTFYEIASYMFEQSIKAFQLYKNEIRKQKLKELYQHGANDNPIVGTHEGADLPHS